MNEEVIKKIAEQHAGNVETHTEDKKKIVTWLVFSMGEERFAIASTSVSEIIRDVEVYPLPFVPSYIEGVLNRRGDPYTVIDPLRILERKTDDGKETSHSDVPLFLVLELKDDQLCLHISDILFFHETAEEDLRVFMDKDKNNISFYKGTVEYNHNEIPVLDADAFEQRLRRDLGSS